MRIYCPLLIILFVVFNSSSVYSKDIRRDSVPKYIAEDGSEVKLSEEEVSLTLPTSLKPLFDYPIRDVSVCLGPDSIYYMTGTTGDPDMWGVTGDIKIWKSKDLKEWTPVVTKPRKRSTVWNADREGSWEKKITDRDGAPFRPLWAPEIHYFNSTFWLAYCLPRLGSGILKSTSGKAEGPYEKVLVKDAPLVREIDPSLFVDDDGTSYFVYGEGMIMPMKPDLSAAAGPARLAVPANAAHVGFEGAFLFKANGLYFMSCAEFINGEYHCMIASSRNIYGPYSDRRLTIPHGGHNTFFKDTDGKWWSTFFGNDKKSPFRDRPALLPVEITGDGMIRMKKSDEPKIPALQALKSAVLFQGDEKVAYRDPAVIKHNGLYYLYFTLSETEADQKVYMYTAMSISRDLLHWSPVKKLTPRDQDLNFSSPGNIIRFGNEWLMCLQTYPRPGYLSSQMPRYGNKDSRIWIMRSKNLEQWTKPELLRVKGPEVADADMGRMIDPYLLEDKDEKGKWWCFYKQDGISMSFSYDLRNWTYKGKTPSGENPCVIVRDGQYVLFHSPENGIGIKRSDDLVHWTDDPQLLTFDQRKWPWAQGRLTAGAVADMTREEGMGVYLLFFHGSGPLTEVQGDFDKNASIGIAWSKDLENWSWPGK